jgi:hypothetical protein
MTLIKSADLDFDTIKSALTDYLKSKPEFSDYNFEASGLSNLLDVLAYNTHLNGLTANINLNESFLTSAQLRSSVISHAETLGYHPRSRTGSTATVTVKVVTSDTSTATAVLPSGTKFTASVDDVSYTFQTSEQYTASNDGTGTFVFKTTAGSDNLIIKEGSAKTKTFIVGDTEDQQVYVIPDATLDTNTLAVGVFDSVTSSSSTTYTDIQKSIRINTDSTVFIVREAPNGYYELVFSDGNVLGKSPVAGNKIVISYLSTKGAAANGAKTFTGANNLTVGSSDYPLTVTTVSNSGAGAAKESIASIKLNAPVAFATQQRLVTAEDYKALILQRHSDTIEDISAWGGNDNVPAKYGAVYLSLKFKDDVSSATQASVKDAIKLNLTDNLAIMSIDTIFSDPIDTFLEVTTTFNFDPDLTGLSVESMQTTVNTEISQFFTDNLSKFGQVFRRSALTAKIDDLNVALLNSAVEIKAQQRWTPTLNSSETHTIAFPIKLAEADDVNRRITTTTFTSGGQTCSVRNVLGSTKLELINALTGAIVKDNVGSYDTETGVVTITGFEVSAYSTSIKISAVPADQATIRPLRNHILKLDTDKSTATGILDFQNTATIVS